VSRSRRPRCYVCGRGLTARTRARLSRENRLLLAIFDLAAPCNRPACLRRTVTTLFDRAPSLRGPRDF